MIPLTIYSTMGNWYIVQNRDIFRLVFFVQATSCWVLFFFMMMKLLTVGLIYSMPLTTCAFVVDLTVHRTFLTTARTPFTYYCFVAFFLCIPAAACHGVRFNFLQEHHLSNKFKVHETSTVRVIVIHRVNSVQIVHLCHLQGNKNIDN